MPLPSTMTPIATSTLTTTAASVTFSNIPATYTDLVLVGNAKTNTAGVSGFFIQINSDTGSNYSSTRMWGNGSSALSARESSTDKIMAGWAGVSFTPFIMHFQNYSNTTTYKSTISRGSDPDSRVAAVVGLWRNTSAINSIKITAEPTASYVADTIFTIYGVKAA